MERLTGGQRVLFRHTRLDTVAPIIADDAQINPVYSTKHVSVTTPTLDNGLLSSTLAARYSYRSPDNFYCRTVPIEDYIPEVAGIALQKVSVGSASGGPILAFPGTPINYKEGSFGVRGRVADLLDQDRAARNFLEVYNAIVVAFEQVLETIDGRIIGDRDGKFRLFVGHGKVYAPKGYEDVFTGRLNKRNIWRLLIEEWSDDLADGYFRERDGIFSPNTYFEGVPAIREGSQDDRPGEVDGDTVSGKEIDLYIARQRGRIKNDMDDRVLVGLRRGTLFAQCSPGWRSRAGSGTCGRHTPCPDCSPNEPSPSIGSTPAWKRTSPARTPATTPRARPSRPPDRSRVRPPTPSFPLGIRRSEPSPIPSSPRASPTSPTSSSGIGISGLACGRTTPKDPRTRCRPRGRGSLGKHQRERHLRRHPTPARRLPHRPQHRVPRLRPTRLSGRRSRGRLLRGFRPRHARIRSRKPAPTRVSERTDVRPVRSGRGVRLQPTIHLRAGGDRRMRHPRRVGRRYHQPRPGLEHLPVQEWRELRHPRDRARRHAVLRDARQRRRHHRSRDR